MTTQVISTTELANIIAEQTPVNVEGLTERAALIATNASKKAAKETVQTVLDAIQAQLSVGNTVNLNGFGKFEVKDVAARTGRNPSTGEELQIEATKRVGFKAATALKAVVKGEAVVAE